MKKLLIILLLCSSAFGQQKPMLGRQVNIAHPPSDFVGAWFFLEGSGNKVFDLSGNGNTGTLVGPWWGSCTYGSALNFSISGADDYIDVADTPSFVPANGFTVIAGMKFDSFAAEERTIISQWGGANTSWLFREDDSGYLEVITYNGADSSTLADNTTNLGTTSLRIIAITYSGGTSGTNGRLYIDGVNVKSGTLDKVPQDVAGVITIGAKSDDKADGFDGRMEFICLYNRALSASEISQLYQDPFCMFVKDDIAIKHAAIPAAAPTGGQVIIINMAGISFLFVFILLLKRRKCE